MMSRIKRAVAFVLVLVLAMTVFQTAAFALPEMPAVKQNTCVSPESKTLSYVVDVAEIKAYLTKEFAECKADIDISKFRIPYAYDYMYALNRLMSYGMPESFHFGSAVFWGNGAIFTRISVKYRNFADTKEKFAAAKAEFNEAADKLLSGVRNEPSLSQAEKALLLHDRLAVLNEYDTCEDRGETPAQSSYSAYGALVKRKSVCQGYALAYMYLLEQAGIDSYYCNSYFLGHAWNIVYIDGEAYHVDVTWDDPVPNISGYVSHDYFLRSSSGIAKEWQTAWVVDFDSTPKSTKYDEYYWRSSKAEFQLVDKKLYYFDNTKRTLNTVKDGKPTVLLENIGDFNTRLSNDGNSVLISAQKSIFKFDIVKNKKSVYYVPLIPLMVSYQIVGFEYSPETVTCHIRTDAGMYKTVKFADGTKSVKPGAFSETDNLLSVELPKSVENIGEDAFCGFKKSEDNNITVAPTVYGYSGSAAEKYANENDLKFISLGKKETHAHAYTVKMTVAPTCVSLGENLFTCECGDKYTEEIPVIAHRIVTDAAVKATCTKDGRTEGKHCSVCGEVTVAQKAVKATGHRYGTATASASFTSDGKTVTKCTVCQAVKSSVTIPKVKTVTLSKTEFVYNGKTQRPSVTVKDSKGKILKNGTDYTVKYSGGKYVGQHTVTVTLKGKYKGTKTLTYKIVPKGTGISKLTAGKKQFTAKWKKQTAQTTGYELQYSTSSSLKNAKTVTVVKNSVSLSAVKKLKSGKRYYVRIRTYKTVKVNGKNVKFYSSWSSVKNVKTK